MARSASTAARSRAEALASAKPAISQDIFLVGRAMARAFAEAEPATRRLAFARTFCSRVVESFWRAYAGEPGERNSLRPSLEPLVLLGKLEELPAAAANNLGRYAAAIDPEKAFYEIGLIYTALLPTEHRAKYGSYYTPPSLTARLIKQATAAGVDWARCRVLDPACGGGAFLAPVAKRILSQVPDCEAKILIQNIATRLRGYEIDPFAAWLSQVALDAVMLPASRAAKRRLPVVVSVCDSLAKRAPADGFDLVIGNPPYGRVTLSAAARVPFKRSLYGHANLYGLFTDIALRHARPGGVIAYVTPTSFLAGEYFKNLRSLLGTEAPPASIDFVAARKGIFEDVLQETLLATYRRAGRSRAVKVSVLSPVNGSGMEIAPLGAFALPKDPSRPWLMPRSADQVHLIEVLSRMPHRLADWGYTVSTGPLVWNRYKSQLADAPGPKRYPLIWAESVTSDGRFVYRAEKKNHKPYFRIEAGDDWLVVRSPCVLLQRTTAKEQQRRLIAAALPASFVTRHKGVVIENHLNMIRPLTGEPLVPAEVLAAFLNSAAADRAFRCVSGSVAVSAYELESLPLPSPAALAEFARLIHRRASRERIEGACRRLYELQAY